eukprot:jgi/Psemu1/69475/estExt_Genemark1.C_8810006
MFRRRASLGGNDAKFFPKYEDPKESILDDSESSDNLFGSILSKPIEKSTKSSFSDKGFNMEPAEDLFSDIAKDGQKEVITDSFPDLEEEGKKDTAVDAVTDIAKGRKKEEVRKLSGHGHDRPRAERESSEDNDITEFMKLVERSRSSTEMKALLLKILNKNKLEELKPFLKSSSRREKNSLDSTSNHDKIKKQSSRRAERMEGARVAAATNDDTVSSGIGLSRSRHSETSLRKKQRDGGAESTNQKSDLNTSSAVSKVRSNRRNNISRRQSLSNMGSDHSSSSFGIGTNRAVSANYISKPETAPEDTHNASWDAPKVASLRDAVDKLRAKSLRNLNIEKDDDDSEASDESDNNDALSPTDKDNTFDGRRGKVGFREPTQNINNLLDDLRLHRDSFGSTKEVEDGEDTTAKEKTKRLTNSSEFKKMGNVDDSNAEEDSEKDLNEESYSSIYGD